MLVLRRILILSLLLTGVLAGCRATPTRLDTREYTLVLLKTGSKTDLTPEESKTIFAGHFANMQRLAREHQLVLAGPFGNPKRDATLRGLFVLATGDANQARAWAETDPGFRAGVFRLELHPVRTRAALPALLERELAREEADKAAGTTRAPGDGIRPFVVLTAADGAALERELAGQQHVLLRARLDGERGWAILDARDARAAEEEFRAALERVGAYTLDNWFATAELEHLPTLDA